MAWSGKRALMGGASGALQAAGTGNPLLIGGNAALQAILGGMTGQEKFDPTPHLRNFQQYKDSVLKDLAPVSREAVSGVNQDLASRGLEYSPVGAGIAAGTERAMKQSALRQLRDQEFGLRQDLTTAGMVDDRQRRNYDQRALAALIGDTARFAGNVMSGSPTDAKGVNWLREKLGIETKDTSAGLTDNFYDFSGNTWSVPAPNQRPASERGSIPTHQGKDPTDFETAPHLRPQTGKDDTEFGTPESEIPRPDYVPTSMNQVDDVDLFDLELPMSADIFSQAGAGGTNANMVSIDGTGLQVPADSTFGRVYAKYKPRFDLLHQQLPGGMMEFIEAFTMA